MENMERQPLNEEELEQATGGEGRSLPWLQFDFQVTAQDDSLSIRAKISQMNPELTAAQVEELVAKAKEWMDTGNFGTYMARIHNGHSTVRVRV